MRVLGILRKGREKGARLLRGNYKHYASSQLS